MNGPGYGTQAGTGGGNRATPPYIQVANRVRAQVADGTLAPGAPAPSGAELSRATGYSSLTCRKALHRLIRDGVLVRGPSVNARPRVPAPARTRGEKALADAARALSAALRTRRRAAGLTQQQFAEIIGVSVTTVGHAEICRLWQARGFWQHADKTLSASGELLALHDAYRAAATSRTAEDTGPAEDIGTQATPGTPPTITLTLSGSVTCINITWTDGKATTVYPPEMPARTPDANPC